MDQRILIIDAHPIYINKLEGFLRGLTYKNILLAKSGREGIEKAELEKPDLIILSGMLPDIDSHEVCRKLKEKNKSTKVIVQIGLFTDMMTVARFDQIGADAILARKEKDLTHLHKAVESLLIR